MCVFEKWSIFSGHFYLRYEKCSWESLALLDRWSLFPGFTEYQLKKKGVKFYLLSYTIDVNQIGDDNRQSLEIDSGITGIVEIRNN